MTPGSPTVKPATLARGLRDEPTRTLLGLPVRDGLLVLVVVLTIAFTIVAFAATTLGATDRHSTLDYPATSQPAGELAVEEPPHSSLTDLWRPQP